MRYAMLENGLKPYSLGRASANPGGTTCLTLFLQRTFSSKAANNVANDGDP